MRFAAGADDAVPATMSVMHEPASNNTPIHTNDA